MSRYDGLIIPRSYSEYINKTDAATLQQALQLPGVLSGAVAAGDNKPVTSDAVSHELTTSYYNKQTVDEKIDNYTYIDYLGSPSSGVTRKGKMRVIHSEYGRLAEWMYITLDVLDRPKTEQRCIAMLYDVNYTYLGIGELKIMTDGKILLNDFGHPEKNMLIFNITYFV